MNKQETLKASLKQRDDDSSISVYLAANSGRTSLQASGVDQFLFWSRNAGVTIYGKLI